MSPGLIARGFLLASAFSAMLPSPSSAAAPVAGVTSHLDSLRSPAAQPAAAKPKPRSSKVVTIENLRFHRSSAQTRLVFDLARPVNVAQQRVTNPDQVIIDLKNAVLSNAARRQVEDDRFPAEITVKQQSHIRQVRVTLAMEETANVTLRTLTKPYRLVMDYVHKHEIATKAPRATITLPPITRQPTRTQRQARLDIETIVLDPGHGGKDPGAIGRDGLTEKDVVLDVALRLRELLRDHLGKKVLMTRDRDEFIELDDRARFANRHKADLFVSIHINAHPNRSARGVEMYHFGIASDRRAMEVAARENGDAIDHARDFLDLIKADLVLSKRIEESQNLAWEMKIAVVNRVGTAYELEDHGVKTAPFYVLRYTAMPSILAELSFISNPVEEKRLRLPAYRQRMAEGLFEGIRNYLNSVQIASAR